MPITSNLTPGGPTSLAGGLGRAARRLQTRTPQMGGLGGGANRPLTGLSQAGALGRAAGQQASPGRQPYHGMMMNIGPPKPQPAPATPAAQQQPATMEPQDQFGVLREIRRQGLPGLGIQPTEPDLPPRPPVQPATMEPPDQFGALYELRRRGLPGLGIQPSEPALPPRPQPAAYKKLL